MQSNWAAEHLLVIRTLMERSAIYRRALAPIVLCLGLLGLAAAAAAWSLRFDTPKTFVRYWSVAGLIGISSSYFMARRQALRDAEPFWSAPTRRVTQALLPPLFVGFVASTLAAFFTEENAVTSWWIVPVWMVLYGCAVHAAGFFMPRGIKLFGWGFVLIGCATAARLWTVGIQGQEAALNLLMGVSFGGLHLAYGVYLHFTEKRANGL